MRYNILPLQGVLRGIDIVTVSYVKRRYYKSDLPAMISFCNCFLCYATFIALDYSQPTGCLHNIDNIFIDCL